MYMFTWYTVGIIWELLLVRACYGIEWKKNFSIEYGIAKVWNGLEDFINGMKKNLPHFTHFPYLLILMLYSY